MKKIVNETQVEGLLYEHDLELKTTGSTSKNPGTPYIGGSISIATDNKCTNIISVHFTYVTATTKNGGQSATFNTLQNIIDGNYCTVMKDGKDKAVKLRVNSAIALNEFYSNRNGQEELVSAKRNEGGFIRLVDELATDENTRNTFKTDMIITSAIHVDAVPERNTPEKMTLKGVIFNFRNDILPVEYSVYTQGGMDYFDSLGISPKTPVFTKVWGRQISETVVRTISEESAFGDASVREVRNTRKDFEVVGANVEPYVWDDASSITVQELNELMTKRETYLAELKGRREEYLKTKGSNPAPAINNSPFNF